MLEILRKKHPEPVATYDMMRSGNFSYRRVQELTKKAKEMGLVEISSRLSKRNGSKKTSIYSITDLGIKVSSSWDRYKKELRELGLEHLIVTEVE